MSKTGRSAYLFEAFAKLQELKEELGIVRDNLQEVKDRLESLENKDKESNKK